MSIDEIKAISEIVQNLAQTGEQVGGNWILWHYGVQIFKDITGTLFGLSIIYAAYRVFTTLHMDHDTDSFFRDMRDTLGTGTSGGLTATELAATMSELRRVVAVHKAAQRAKKEA